MVNFFFNFADENFVGFLLDNELTLKAPITTAADDIYKYFFIVFQGKTRQYFM